MNDGMARRAGKPGMSLWSVDLLFDRSIESAIEKQGVIMTSGAPFAWLSAHHVLHVFNGFAIKLVIERGKMMR
jgi:hypothetical protein